MKTNIQIHKMYSPMGLHIYSRMGLHTMYSGTGCHMHSGMGCHITRNYEKLTGHLNPVKISQQLINYIIYLLIEDVSEDSKSSLG